MPKWMKSIIWVMVLIYPFWTLGQAVPGLKMFPGSWLSPTYGQVFGFGDVPGYMGLQDMWERINPAGTTPPEGWQPSEDEMRAVFASYDWSAACTQAGNQVAQAGIYTVADDDSNQTWMSETFGALGDALREELLDPENLKDYGDWFYDGARSIVGILVAAFLEDDETNAQRTSYVTALSSFEAGVRAQCACPVVAGPGAQPAIAAAFDAYSNGRIPLAALMPLQTAPGELLRPDAAAAFDAMSRAYQADMGRPITVTDSYRSYDEQVATKASKGWLAATPGTSNHGRGVAVDLGGGINRFGTAQRAWMVANAGRFGWESPSWAQPNGSKPEAWHWEFVDGGSTGPITTVAASTAQATTASPEAVARDAIIKAGFPADQVETALRISYAESGWNPNAQNPTSSAKGLFQTMMSYHEPKYAGADWSDPYANARVAFQIWSEAGGWERPWSQTLNSPAFANAPITGATVGAGAAISCTPTPTQTVTIPASVLTTIGA